MLYPIELLRHSASTPIGASEDGVHVNGTWALCHVVFGLHGCGPYPFILQGMCTTMHFAMHHMATIAKRMLRDHSIKFKTLIYKDFL